MIIPLFTIVNNLFYVLLDYMFCGSVFKESRINRRYLCVLSWITIQIASSYLLASCGYIKVLFALLTATVFCYLLFNASKARSFMAQLCFTALHTCLEALVVIFIQRFITVSIKDMRGSLVWVVAGTTSQLFVYIAIFILRTKTRRSDFSSLSVRTWLIYALLPALSLIGIFAISYTFPGNMGEKETMVLFFITIIMLAMNLIAFYLLNSIVIKERIIADNNMQRERNQNINWVYSNIAEQRAEQQSQIHDHKRLINTALTLAKNEAYEDLVEFLQEQVEDANIYLDNFDCKNPLINAVVNTKYNEACKCNISASVELSDLSNINIARLKLVLIIANIWDNAVEAASKCDENERRIVFKSILDKGYLKIYCENTFNGNIKIDKGIILSSKSDKNYHGYGIEIIRKCAADCGGNAQIIVDDNLFKIAVQIPVK